MLIELDVEGLAHMGAAVAQDLHHLRLILHRVELGFDRLRGGRDLAERQRRREQLDENDVHWRRLRGNPVRETRYG